MYSTFHVKASELNESFLKGVKALFKNRTISITIEEEMDETEYLLASPANRKMLEESLNSEEGYAYSAEEFEQLNEDLRKGRSIDISKARKVKIPK